MSDRLTPRFKLITSSRHLRGSSRSLYSEGEVTYKPQLYSLS